MEENMLRFTMVFLLLMCCLLTITRAAELEKIYTERLKKSKDEPVLMNAAARFYSIKGNSAKAEAILKKNLSNHPADSDSLFLLAAIKASKKEYKEAKDMLMVLIRKDPGNMANINLLIYIMENTGKSEMAEKYRKAIRDAPIKVDNKSIKSILKIASATSMLKNAQKNKLEKIKQERKSLYFKNSTLSVDKQDQLAKKLAEKIQDINKTTGFDSKDFKGMMGKMKDLLKKAPDSKYAQMTHWGIHYFHYGLSNEDGKEDNVELQACLESYLAKYPNDEINKLEAYDKLTMAAEELEDWETMMYYSELYLAKSPDNLPMQYNHATALIKLGEVQRGVEMLEKIVVSSDGSVQYWLAKQDLEELN